MARSGSVKSTVDCDHCGQSNDADAMASIDDEIYWYKRTRGRGRVDGGRIPPATSTIVEGDTVDDDRVQRPTIEGHDDSRAKENKHNWDHKGDACIELETRSQFYSSRPASPSDWSLADCFMVLFLSLIYNPHNRANRRNPHLTTQATPYHCPYLSL
ncbi:hypothetical protein BHM03_00038722 [Ensete ventricosum]|nr:hypothetical protein BHM03_00038722 [Ensete ventricosum]